MVDSRGANQTRAQLKNSALALLARREHSRRELTDKLSRRAGDGEQLQALLDQLQAQGLQSDERFAESFLRSRIARGQGPLRIQQQLRQKGIDSELLSAALEAEAADWYQLAVQLREKRFGLGLVTDRKAYAKQVRFLLYRGFSQDQVQHAMKASAEDADS